VTEAPARFPLAAWVPLLLGAATAATLPGHSLAWGGVLLAGLAARAALDAAGRAAVDGQARVALWTLLPVFGAVLLAHAISTSGHAGPAALGLAPVVQALLLLGPQSGPIAAVVLALAGAQVAGAALISPSPGMSAAAVLWVATLVPAVLALERRAFDGSHASREAGVRRVRAGAGGASPRRLPRAAAIARATLALLLVGLPLGWLLFAALPRSPVPAAEEPDEVADGARSRRAPGAGLGGRGDPGAEASPLGRPARDFLSGVRSDATLGFVSDVKRDQTPVLRVRVGAGEPGPLPLTLRGVTYDVFAGTEWRRSAEAARVVRRAAGEGGSPRWVEVSPSRGDALWRLTVTDLTGRADGLLFLMPEAERVRTGERHADAQLAVAGDGTVKASRPLAAGEAYLEDAREPGGGGRERLRGARSDAALAPWPALTALPDAPFYAARARGLFGDARDALERAERIEAGLREGWPYRLRSTPGERAPTLREFLAERRPASCEWFASAMVLLMRAHGHPARLAVGFRAGPLDYMESLGEWSVRASHAHAWCEVLFEGAGWVAFDPTPGDGEAQDAPAEPAGTDEDEPSFLERLARWSPADREWLGERIAAAADAVSRAPWTPALVGGAALLLVVALLRLRRRRRLAALPGAGGAGPAGLFPPYGRAVRALEGGGIVRARPETASEYAAQAGRALPEAAPPFSGLTRAYEALRFGGVSPGPEERAAAAEAAAAVERAAAARRARAAEAPAVGGKGPSAR
jgi:hypothetical protein